MDLGFAVLRRGRIPSSEHHVLEKWASGPALFDLVARAHPHDAVVGGEAGAVEADPDELEPVSEVLDVDGIGEDLLPVGGGGGGDLHHEEKPDPWQHKGSG
jgi:hypothetical protein